MLMLFYLMLNQSIFKTRQLAEGEVLTSPFRVKRRRAS